MATAAIFYDNASLGLGSAFLDEITRSIKSLRRQPQKGKAIRGGLRIQVLRRFPFRIIYAVESEGILIVAVAHQSRRPGFWRDRLD